MLVVNRFRVPEDEVEQFRAEVTEAHAALAEQRGYLHGRSAATSTTRRCGRW